VKSYSGPLETETDESLEIYKTSILPKVLEWMSDDYIVYAPKLTRLRARPHSFVSNLSYWLFHDLLKCGPAEQVKAVSFHAAISQLKNLINILESK